MSNTFDLSGRRIWVAGHTGMVGSALCRRLATENCEILTTTRKTVDLRNQASVARWMDEARPDAVFVAAATVGGINANNTRPAEFIYDNLAIEVNVIESARQAGVAKLMLLGSSCIYPRMASQPMKEDALLTGPLEETNQWYAIAKIAGIKMCQAYRRQYGCDFVSVMPTNLYGPFDNYDLTQSHVVPALLRKAHEAKVRGDAIMPVWGSGTVRREFLHVDDMADACVYLMKAYSDEQHVNIGSGVDVTIRELAGMICKVVGFKGEFVFDPSKPNGTPRKLLDVSKLQALGWDNARSLEKGLADAYAWYRENEHVARLEAI